MKIPLILKTILLFLVTTLSCLGNPSNKTEKLNSEKGSNTILKDSAQATESFNKEDLPVNGYLTTELKPIRENFKRLNSIENWSNIKTQEIWESTEGGEAKYYYQNNNLQKIITHHFGETFQKLTEYYLKDGELSFVFEKLYEYNRPIYYDSNAKDENNDTELFYSEKPEIFFNSGSSFIVQLAKQRSVGNAGHCSIDANSTGTSD